MEFLDELKKRKVLRTAGLYAIGAWLALQAAEVLVGLNVLPEEIGRPLFIVLVVGFPIAVVLSWFLRWMPGGIRTEEEADPASEAATGDNLRMIVIITLATVIAIIGSLLLTDQPLSTQETQPQVALAVLPLATVGPPGSEEYWADGITEQLIGMISRIHGIAVTSRTSAFSMKGSSAAIPEIAEQLSVDYVLTGSVQHDAQKIRVRVELIDADRDVHVWANSYDLAEQSIFAAQDAITEAVGLALTKKFSDNQQSSIVTDPQAHKLFLQGMHAHRLGSDEGLSRALELCQQSVAIDPLYAPAWECIASTYTNKANRHQIDQRHGYELAVGAARKAIEIEADSALAYQTLGYIQNYYHGDIQAAANAYRESMRITPGSPSSGYALLLASVGHFGEAVQLSEKVVRRDPLNPIIQGNMAGAYFWVQNLEEALDRYKLVLSMEPDYFAVNYRISECLVALGRYEEALDFAEGEHHPIYRLIGLALVHHSLGDHDIADELVDKLEKEHADIAAYNIAYVKAHRGKSDEAFAYLKKELELSGRGVFSEVLGDHFFENIRSDPRWTPFLAKVGRAPEQLADLDISPP